MALHSPRNSWTVGKSTCLCEHVDCATAAPPASAGLVKSDGFAQLSEEAFVRDFAGDLDADRAHALSAVQGRISVTLFASGTTQAAWRTKPTWYAQRL